MDLERWIHRTMEVQSIPAPTFQESERAEFLRHEFINAELEDLVVDPVGNLLARVRGGDGPPLVVSAHLDSVFPQETDLSSRRSEKRIAGPGIGDNAVALAALVELAYDLRENGPTSDIWLVADTCEEGLGNLQGMREIVARFGKGVSAYLVLEGMALGHIYHRALPAQRYRVQTKSIGGHSWIHADRSSALHQLIRVGNELTSLELPDSPKTTLNIGQLHGGRSINTIADAAYMELDLRSESQLELENLAKRVESVVASFAPDGAMLGLHPIGSRPSGALPQDHPLVLAAVQATKSIRRKPILAAGSTDASIPLSLGYPAVCVGLTTGGEAHSLSEYIDIPPMESGYRGLRRLIEAALSLEPQH